MNIFFGLLFFVVVAVVVAVAVVVVVVKAVRTRPDSRTAQAYCYRYSIR